MIEMIDYYKLCTENLGTYIKMLVKDFNENKDYAFAFNTVFLAGYSIEKYIVEDRIIKDLYSWEHKGLIPYNTESNGIEIIEKNKLTFDNILFNFPKDNLYNFFRKEVYNSEIEARGNFPAEYFFIDVQKFVEKVDNMFLGYFPDYIQAANKTVYEKKINNKYSFVLSTEKEQDHCLNIQNYIFPEFYIRADGEQSMILRNTDVNSLLFMAGTSFLHFYSYFNLYTRNKQGKTIDIKTLYDEPNIYHDNFINKYTISNSPEKIHSFNTFIYLSLELTVHYMRIFEKWLITLLEY